ncbi:MAG TPA: DUF2892 domain-containing protein [Burkholderiaceae bacterium]|nr:DUF2892 domain-containing protein [Burkholderiaceae bacterium]
MWYRKNLPMWERVFRVLAGLLLAVIGFMYLQQPWQQWLSVAVAVIMGSTGFVGFCPACALVGRRPIE